ncbi:hypothetical protein IMSAGC019_02990 [Lachnospiraceae bacterium]|nr:hypothetical protein IMSAGC019_02990 [Lachnospiraceae bacterium]
MHQKDAIKKIKEKFTKDNFLVIALVGVLLLVIAWPVEEKNGKKEAKSVQWDSPGAIMGIGQEGSTAQAGQEQETGGDYLFAYAGWMEDSLEELLGTMEGVGKVKVMVTLEDSGESLVEKDVNTTRNDTAETDSAGGVRNATNASENRETVYQRGQGNVDMPYVKKVLSPRVEGVVVSAQGGGNARTARNITEAIQALFGIEAHKIKIVKMISQ